MKRKSLFFLSTFMVLAMLLSACGPQMNDGSASKEQTNPPSTEEPTENTTDSEGTENNVVDQEMDEQTMKAHIAEQQKTIDELNDELDYYRRYVKDITLTLTPEKLQQLIDKEWKYTMTINNIQFPKNGILEISNTDFEIILVEERAKYSVLKEEDSLKGRLQGNLNSKVSVMFDNERINPQEELGDIETTLTYSLKGLEPDDIINITLQEDMREKLGMSTNELEIRVVR